MRPGTRRPGPVNVPRHIMAKSFLSGFRIRGVLGSVCTKYFERADKSCAEDKTLEPDVYLDLEDKDVAWEKLMELCL